MEGRTDRSNGDRPLTVDNHSHISQVEVQDIGDEYDKKFKYGMSHRDNLFLMDAIGVDVQVLHCSGYLHSYHRRVLRENPDRFAAIAKIDERMLPGDEGLELLRTYVEDWGFKGWYYDPWSPESRAALGYDPKDWGSPDPFYHFDDERYDPQWELVQSLGVPACITCYPQNFDTVGPALLNVFEKFPDLTVVLIHGIDPPSCLRDDGTVSIPESAVKLITEHDVYMDLLTGLDGLRGKPNRYGPNDEVIKAFYDTFGPSKLMWGSEFTDIERPTVDQYRYQLDYIEERCSYMTEDDLALIRGENARKVYGL